MAKKTSDELAEQYAQLKEERDALITQNDNLTAENAQLKLSIAKLPSRIEQRDTAIAKEFRELKPKMSSLKIDLDTLIKQGGAYAATMLNIYELLKQAFPLKLSDEDVTKLKTALHKVVSNELDWIDDDIKRKSNRVSLPQSAFYVMIYILAIMACALGVIGYANIHLLHASQITTVLWGLIALIIIPAIIIIVYVFKH
jgi:seryl-tRNA synthetase